MMVVPLGQADSFNSSGATIVPDQKHHQQHSQGGRYNTRSRLSTGPATGHNQSDARFEDQPRRSGSSSSSHSNGNGNGTSALRPVPSLVSSARMLMPSDSLGRELDEALGREGEMELLQSGQGQAGQSGQGWDFMGGGYTTTDDILPNSQMTVQELSFSQILRDSPPNSQDQIVDHDSNHDHNQHQSHLHHRHHSTDFLPEFNPQQQHLNSGTGPEVYRPTSAHSLSSALASEYSFSSTDVDTADGDSVMSDSAGLAPGSGNMAGTGGTLPDIDMNAISLGGMRSQLSGVESGQGQGHEQGHGAFQMPWNDYGSWEQQRQQSQAQLQPQHHNPDITPGGWWKTVAPETVSLSPPDLKQFPLGTTSSNALHTSQSQSKLQGKRQTSGGGSTSISGRAGSREDSFSVAGDGDGDDDEGDEKPREGESEKKRQQRLEHRRQINRKSAQKHRLRRKEEHEHLTRTIADRDARIAQLEREVAVERAKVAQLEGLLRGGGWGGRVTGGGG